MPRISASRRGRTRRPPDKRAPVGRPSWSRGARPPRPSSASGSPGSTAGGIAEGGLISQTRLDVPDTYCIEVLTAEPFPPGDCYPGNAGAVWFVSGNGYIKGNQLVLLNPGATVDFHECSTNTKYAKDGEIPYSRLKSGSEICFRSRENQIVGAIRIEAMPDPKAISEYWAVTRILWRANTG